MSGADQHEQEALDSQSALAPTLDAIAAVLPWVRQAQLPRFSDELNTRWQAACQELATHWCSRVSDGYAALRPPIIRLLASALETGDADFLHLCETLASTADHLEIHPPGNRLIAALSGTIEMLQEDGGLENPHLAIRARHFTQRLTTAMRPSGKPGERSDVLDAIFVQDAHDCLQHMHEALDALPIDVYAIELEAGELIAHAEQIEMWGIYHQARQLQNFALQLSDASEPVQDQARRDILKQLDLIEQTLRAVDY